MENDRRQLLNQIVEFVKNSCEFECLLQIGSGADGFTDIYSDIDLMAGCIDVPSVEIANSKLCSFFSENGAVYLDCRKWSTSALGISAYFENGLSVDLSFMPTCDMPIRSNHWLLLWSSKDDIETVLVKKTKNLASNDVLINEQFHHRFFFTLRKAEIGIRRKNYIYADIAISEARQMLLLMEATVEGKKTHQFKAFHTLDPYFLSVLQGTYPKEFSQTELTKCKDFLLSMYVNVIEKNGLCKVDDSQFMIVNCFAR